MIIVSRAARPAERGRPRRRPRCGGPQEGPRINITWYDMIEPNNNDDNDNNNNNNDNDDDIMYNIIWYNIT